MTVIAFYRCRWCQRTFYVTANPALSPHPDSGPLFRSSNTGQSRDNLYTAMFTLHHKCYNDDKRMGVAELIGMREAAPDEETDQ